MGKPALRIGDLTAHGGTVTVGKPNILIGKMPASTLGDMHVCPMLTGPVPHVGGPAIMGSTGVMLSKMPGARVSDPHVCVGPPSMGAMGCMTVLLGEAGSGGDAGNAAAAASAASMSKKGPKAISPFPVAELPTPRTENHYLECKVSDQADFVLPGIKYKIKDPDGKDVIGSSSFEGCVRHSGYLQAGSFKIEFPAIAKVDWPSLKNKPHEKLKLEASVTGFADGTEAFISIFEERDRGKYKRLLADLKGKVSGGKVEVEWTFAKEHYPLPRQDESKMHALEEKPEGKIEYFFFVVVEGCIGVSKNAQFLDDAEIAVVDKDKKPMANEEYKIRLVDGSMRSGKLDKDGKAKVKDIPVGHYELDLVKLVKSLETAKKKIPEAKSGEKTAHRRKGQKAEAATRKLAHSAAGQKEDKKSADGNHNSKSELDPPEKIEMRFPLDTSIRKTINKHYHTGGRVFGYPRKKKGGGLRSHAGCDLICPAGTPIYAVADGIIIAYHNFYMGTFYIQINHYTFTVNYGEVQPDRDKIPLKIGFIPPIEVCKGLASGLNVGSKVKRGQLIGWVGELRELKEGKQHRVNSMLHFEMYKEASTDTILESNSNGFLYVPENPYLRRKDLLNPTKYLDEANDE